MGDEIEFNPYYGVFPYHDFVKAEGIHGENEACFSSSSMGKVRCGAAPDFPIDPSCKPCRNYYIMTRCCMGRDVKPAPFQNIQLFQSKESQA